MSRGTLWSVVAIVLAGLALGAAPAAAQDEEGRVLLYTGTTGYRHASAIDPGTPIVRDALVDAGYAVDVET